LLQSLPVDERICQSGPPVIIAGNGDISYAKNVHEKNVFILAIAGGIPEIRRQGKRLATCSKLPENQ
jgi:hypothetical protein